MDTANRVTDDHVTKGQEEIWQEITPYIPT